MRHGLAVWNFASNAEEVPALLNELPGWGFDAAAFHPRPLLEAEEPPREAIAARVAELDLVATVHGKCEMTRDEIATTAALFGDRLRCYTFDAAITMDSRGQIYDAERIAKVLGWTLDITETVGAWVAMEDFPLDARAMDFFAEALRGVWDDPRVGILIDLGHMHLRRTRSAYFGDRTVADYLEAVPLPIVELHVHDNDGDRDEHRHLGEGTLPLTEAAAAIRALGFRSVSTIEVAPALHGAEPDAERGQIPETLRRWRATLEA